MADQTSENPAYRQNENLLPGSIVIDQNSGTIRVYDRNTGQEVMRLGFVGYDNDGQPLYGMLMFDETGTPQFFAGKQPGGF